MAIDRKKVHDILYQLRLDIMMEIALLAEAKLGMNGRLLSFSKVDYSQSHRKNITIFNSNVVTKKYGKIWYGDLDITEMTIDLMELAKELDESVFVLYESDGRFGNEQKPRFERAVVEATATEIKILDEWYKKGFTFIDGKIVQNKA